MMPQPLVHPVRGVGGRAGTAVGGPHAGEPPRTANAIGFLRFALAAAVIYQHSFLIGGFNGGNASGDLLSLWSNQRLSTGFAAVQGFFVLSGALIATSWSRSSSLRRFLWHRALRLLPAFWVCLAVTAFVLAPLLWWTTSGANASFLSLRPSAVGYIWENLFSPRAQINIGALPNGGPWAGDWNGSLWTLFYEAACYLFVAGLGLATLLTVRRRVGTAILAAFILAYVAINALQLSSLPYPLARLYNTPGKELTVYFMAGVVWSMWPQFTAKASRPWLVAVAAVVLIAAWRAGHSEFGPLLFPVVLFGLARALPLSHFERMVGGDYSYGLYVYGYPIQQTLAHFNAHHLGLAAFCLLSCAGAGVFAVTSWHLVEKHCLRLKAWTPPLFRSA